MTTTLTPIATLTDRGVGVADIDAALVAATEVGHVFTNDGNIMAFISNGGGVAVTATLVAEPDPYGRGATANDEVISIPAGGVGMFSLANPAMFNAGGLAALNLSVFASVKIGIYRIRKVR